MLLLLVGHINRSVPIAHSKAPTAGLVPLMPPRCTHFSLGCWPKCIKVLPAVLWPTPCMDKDTGLWARHGRIGWAHWFPEDILDLPGGPLCRVCGTSHLDACLLNGSYLIRWRGVAYLRHQKVRPLFSPLFRSPGLFSRRHR